MQGFTMDMEYLGSTYEVIESLLNKSMHTLKNLFSLQET
jgi:hypothetical protein